MLVIGEPMRETERYCSEQLDDAIAEGRRQSQRSIRQQLAQKGSTDRALLPCPAHLQKSEEASTLSPCAKSKKAGPPLWAIPAVLVTLFGVWRLTSRRGSVDTLADRGVGLEKDRNVDADRFYQGMMKNVRTTEMPELTPDEIEAARARRRQEQVTRGEESVESLAEMELPTNHPWAVSEKETEEEKAKREAQVNAQANRRRMRMEPTDNEG
ncbi:hypothetical protein CYMTET_14414 [Cymbomonas tetramitiformis]|uniref:Uncharacterized protein n=1 Tax=Cymbomonas tetramitiformis TaxID=36881 RepID=A0AAE0GGE8_9CHLO|nr:hypothetical protein CYMTET_14414 [Cymbomonas tetramitiformis]